MAEDRLSRRVVLKAGAAGAGLAGTAALLGCSGTPAAVMRAIAQDAGAKDAAVDASVEVSGDVSGEAAAEVSPSQPPALSDDQLLAAIDTVVVLCMENRSFDQVFGARSLLESRPVDGITRAMKNVARDGREIFVNPLDRFSTPDPPHTWEPMHRQWNEGAMDGFAREYGDAGVEDVMGYYEDLNQFFLCSFWRCLGGIGVLA